MSSCFKHSKFLHKYVLILHDRMVPIVIYVNLQVYMYMYMEIMHLAYSCCEQ